MQIINGKILNRTLLTNNGHLERQPINYSKNNLPRVNLNCAPQREHRKIQYKYNKLSITKSTGQMQIINGKISNRTLLKCT